MKIIMVVMNMMNIKLFWLQMLLKITSTGNCIKVCFTEEERDGEQVKLFSFQVSQEWSVVKERNAVVVHVIC